MSTTKKTLGKRMQDMFRNGVYSQLNELYYKAINNIPFEITDEMAFDAFIRGEDKEFVRRSGELYPHVMARIYGMNLIVSGVPGTNYNLILNFQSGLSWMPPAYLQGKTTPAALPPEFLPTIMPFIEYAEPFRNMFNRTTKAWNTLIRVCENDLSRMRYLWPALDSLAASQNINLALLPKPRGVPAVPPELREDLNVATAFINTVMLMPEPQNRNRKIRVDLTD